MRFVILGDGYRGKEAASTEVLRTLLSRIKLLSPQPDFIFTLGDMIDGRSDVSKELEVWKSVIGEFYPISMFYPVIGNHEDNERLFSNAFPHLPDGQLAGYRKTAYFFDYKEARFIVLNSIRTGKTGSYSVDAKQRQWLEEVLSGSTRKYHFVMLHIPAFPVGSHYGCSLDADVEERNALWKILDNHKVTAVFAGHEHNYCRRLIDKTFESSSLPIKNSKYHITAGGGGASLSAKVADTKNIINGPFAVQHFAVVDVSNAEAALRVYDIENKLIDICSLSFVSSEPQIGPSNYLLIQQGAEWRYLDNGTDPGPQWTNAAFDDSSWKSGAAELGYGDGGEVTKVSYGPNVNQKYITTYFRKTFNVRNIALYKSLTLKILRDDGAVVYINGREVFRTNMPPGAISYKTLASTAVKGEDEVNFQTAAINARILRAGRNIIAVEIHQASASSSDISFDLQLLGNRL